MSPLTSSQNPGNRTGATLRSEAEIRSTRDALIEQQRGYRHAKQQIEAMACAIQVSALTWALGETDGPTARVKVRDF